MLVDFRYLYTYFFSSMHHVVPDCLVPAYCISSVYDFVEICGLPAALWFTDWIPFVMPIKHTVKQYILQGTAAEGNIAVATVEILRCVHVRVTDSAVAVSTGAAD